MSTKKEIYRFAQREFGISDDGIVGPVTRKYANKLPSLVPDIKANWSAERKLIAFVQHKANILEIDAGEVDGLIGPQTLEAFEQLCYFKEHGRLPATWRDEDNDNPYNLAQNSRTENPHQWPKYEGIRGFYGKQGQNLVIVPAPYPLRIAWNTVQTTERIMCHRLVAHSLTGVLETVRDHYGLHNLKRLGLDLYGGCFNQRKMRGGSKLSTHAWGVAIDLDPSHNRLKWDHTKARFARPQYAALRDAFAYEGWVSLGEAKDYDWMHFQAVRV